LDSSPVGGARCRAGHPHPVGRDVREKYRTPRPLCSGVPGVDNFASLLLWASYRLIVVGLPRSARRNRPMAEKIHAEMVANVLKVMMAEGQVVKEGDTVVLLESMKMEIPVLTESGGMLTKLAVKEGDVVQEHDLIAVIE
jgi:acetyl-CoA carboxylase biotin carboxyl carrier protein